MSSLTGGEDARESKQSFGKVRSQAELGTEGIGEPARGMNRHVQMGNRIEGRKPARRSLSSCLCSSEYDANDLCTRRPLLRVADSIGAHLVSGANRRHGLVGHYSDHWRQSIVFCLDHWMGFPCWPSGAHCYRRAQSLNSVPHRLRESAFQPVTRLSQPMAKHPCRGR
jgi:hypothetical protein